MEPFYFNCDLLSRSGQIRFQELKYPVYKNLIKTIYNNNSVEIANFFEMVIKHLSNGELKLTVLDKLYALITIRSICLSPVLELNLPDKENKDHFLSVDLTKLIAELKAIEIPESLLNKKLCHKNINVELGIPSNLFYENNELSYLTTIKSISIDSKYIESIDNSVLDLLPANIIKDCKEHFFLIEKFLSNISLLKFSLNSDNVDLCASLTQNTILEFLKLIFKRDLLSLYEFEYFFVAKASLNSDILNTATPAELNVFLNIFKKDLEDKAKSQTTSSKELNLPVSGPK